MTATGDVLYLPVPRPVRSPFAQIKLMRQSPRRYQHDQGHRIHRLPRQERQRFTYGANGYTTSQITTGRIIDIRV